MRLIFALLVLSACAHTPVIAATASAPPVAPWVDLSGPIDDDSSAAFIMAFTDRVLAGDREVLIRIDSPGGSVSAGLMIIRYIGDVRAATGVTTTCVVDGMSASMAFIILQSEVCAVRVMTKRSVLLAHNASSSANSSNANELEQLVQHLRVISAALAEIAGRRLTIGVDGYKARVAYGDWVFGWEEALGVGAVDGIVAPPAP